MTTTTVIRGVALGLGATAVAVGLAATAPAAPSGPVTAQDMIDQLKLNGYRVVVAPTGSTPLSECTVTSVRRGAAVQTPTAQPGSDGAQRMPRYTPVFVEVAC